jgi:hypothetical protein
VFASWRDAHYRLARTRAAPAHLTTSMAMPRTCPGTADAIELAETLQLIAGWLTTDPATLAPSFLAYTGHPAYGP